jgi:predicted  nucleic acid-binding Zn-ribbon protein
MELQTARDGKDSLEMVIEQVNMEMKEEKQRVDNLEKKLKEVFTIILDNAQEAMRNSEEQIQIIAQTIEDYKKEIEELKEKLTQTTPPEVMAEREQQDSPASGNDGERS